MTTKITVDAHAGWDVRVLKIDYDPDNAGGSEDVVVDSVLVEAGTKEDFYIHQGRKLTVIEVRK